MPACPAHRSRVGPRQRGDHLRRRARKTSTGNRASRYCLCATIYPRRSTSSAASLDMGPHMTATEVHQLAVDGFEVGSHTVDHLCSSRRLTPERGRVGAHAERGSISRQITGQPVMDASLPRAATTNAAVEAQCTRRLPDVPGLRTRRGDPARFSTAERCTRSASARRSPSKQVRAWIELGRAPKHARRARLSPALRPAAKMAYAHPARPASSGEMRFLATSGIPVVSMRDAVSDGRPSFGWPA